MTQAVSPIHKFSLTTCILLLLRLQVMAQAMSPNYKVYFDNLYYTSAEAENHQKMVELKKCNLKLKGLPFYCTTQA